MLPNNSDLKNRVCSVLDPLLRACATPVWPGELLKQQRQYIMRFDHIYIYNIYIYQHKLNTITLDDPASFGIGD